MLFELLFGRPLEAIRTTANSSLPQVQGDRPCCGAVQQDVKLLQLWEVGSPGQGVYD